jgi:hypothetical protein
MSRTLHTRLASAIIGISKTAQPPKMVFFSTCTRYICSTGPVSVTNTLFYIGTIKGRGRRRIIYVQY